MGKLDTLDALCAFGTWTAVTLWAFLWAYPYPHPDLWPFLAAYGGHFSLTAISILGKLALGAFAAFVYLILRGAWIRFRDHEDELPDTFFFTRFCPLCGAALFALSPLSWRAGQFLSPDFALTVLTAFAVVLWQQGCGYRHLTLACSAYLILAFVTGLRPLGLAALGYVTVCDIMRRWLSEQMYGQRDEDKDARRRRSIERTLSIAAGLVGFGLSVHFAMAYFPGGMIREGLVSGLCTWGFGWLAAAQDVFRSFPALALVTGCGFAAAALALGRRLRTYGPTAFVLSVSLASILALVSATFVLRAVDWSERTRLSLIRDYIRIVLEDSDGADWLFTDGRFDDALRFEIGRLGRKLRVLNALLSPTREQAAHLRTLAPESGDADLFAAGGAEVLKAWARERPDRLAASAWQLGASVVRRYDKIPFRTCGSVMRAEDGTAAPGSEAADVRFAGLTQTVRDTLERPAFGGPLFGRVDAAVAQRFDALAWRAARMAGERSEAAAKAGKSRAADAERATMQTLDSENATLQAQGNAVELLLPTAKLILTPREALEVSLKRADFRLARRYAHEVLVSSPDDMRALFALGMYNLETREYLKAANYLEHALQSLPNEPAMLNNLALAYLKLGRLEEAEATAERALKAHPDSKPILENLAEIRKARNGVK